jgi:lysophospholipase L1-like esterase
MSLLSNHYNLSWKLVAETGSKTLDGIRWLQDMNDIRPDFVITIFGVNDVTSGSRLSSWIQLQQELRDTIRKLHPDVRIN